MNNIKPQTLPENASWIFFYEENGELQQISVETRQLRSDEGFVIGRNQNKPHLSIDHCSISKTHCRLFIDEQGLLHVVDLESSNGVFINEQRLERGQTQALDRGDNLRLAELSLTVVSPLQQKDKALTHFDGENKTILSSVPHQPIHKVQNEFQQGKTVEHQTVFIEKVMTFGARKPLISFLLVLLITIISALGLLNLKLDTSYDSMLDKKDPNIPIYNQVIKEFGSDNLVLIYYQHDNLFTADKLKIVDDVTYALQDLEIIEKVESLATTLSIRNSDYGLAINQLISSLPETKAEIATIKDNALYSPLIRGNHLSKDGKKAAIIVTLRPTFNEPEFNRKAYDSIESVIKPLHAEFDNVFQIGNPRVNVEFEQGIFSDLTKITPLAILVLITSIVLMLRTPMAAVLPLITSSLSIVWALGFLGYCGIPINLLTAILPALIIVIGSTEDTHMLAAYLQGIAKNNDQQRFPAIRFMAIHVGLPIFITSFTTTIGFLSNGLSDITLTAIPAPTKISININQIRKS